MCGWLKLNSGEDNWKWTDVTGTRGGGSSGFGGEEKPVALVFTLEKKKRGEGRTKTERDEDLCVVSAVLFSGHFVFVCVRVCVPANVCCVQRCGRCLCELSARTHACSIIIL